MNPFDLVVVGVVLLSVIAGMWRGIVAELLSLAAWGVALFAGWLWGEALGELLFADALHDPRLRWVAGGLLLALVVFLVNALLRVLLGEVLKISGLASFDRFLGAWFGLARGVAVVLLAAQILLWLGAGRTEWWQSAQTRPWVEWALAEALTWLPKSVTERMEKRGV